MGGCAQDAVRDEALVACRQRLEECLEPSEPWITADERAVLGGVVEEALGSCREECEAACTEVEPWLTPLERAALGGLVEELRQGVVPIEGSVGLCRVEGERCEDDPIRIDSAPLAPGKYHLAGRFVAPRVDKQGGWHVGLERSCRAASGVPNTTRNRWKVTHAPAGYRLDPMVVVTSPAKEERTCTYRLLLETLEGVETLEGSYIIPAESP